MDRVSYSEVRADLAAAMDRVEADRVPIAITRRGAADVVMIAKDEWDRIRAVIGETPTDESSWQS